MMLKDEKHEKHEKHEKYARRYFLDEFTQP